MNALEGWGDMHAKDLDDVDVLRVVERCADGLVPYCDGTPAPRGRWTHNNDVERRFPEAHPRVVLAKMRALLRRGLITGCACGCRGNYELTAEGRTFLAAQATRT